jgi:hypothetical protein
MTSLDRQASESPETGGGSFVKIDHLSFAVPLERASARVQRRYKFPDKKPQGAAEESGAMIA